MEQLWAAKVFSLVRGNAGRKNIGKHPALSSTNISVVIYCR